MSLNYVTLTGTLPLAAGATAVFTPSGWLTDPTDTELIPPAPQVVTLTAVPGTSNGTFSVSLLATDNADVATGWTWSVTIRGIPGVPGYTFSFALAHANGATQDISTLATTSPSAFTFNSQLSPLVTIPAGDEAETVIGTYTIPPGLGAGATFRLTTWMSFSVGNTAGPWTVKSRIGGLGSPFLGSITTTAWAANSSGGAVLDSIVQLVTPGTSGQWAGFMRDSSLAGTITNTASQTNMAATKDSTVSELFVITMALGSVTMSASAIGIGERLL